MTLTITEDIETTTTTVADATEAETTAMTAEQFGTWIEALRSGDFAQARSQLRVNLDVTPEGEFTYGYCCLGLYSHLNGVDLDVPAETIEVDPFGDPSRPACGLSGMVDYNTPKILAVMPNSTREALAYGNDGGRSFADIADALERNRDRVLAGEPLDTYALFEAGVPA